MIRNIHLHGSLALATDQSVYRLDCDDQAMLFAALKSISSSLERALRKVKEVKLISIKLEAEKAEPLEPNFKFGSAVDIHLMPCLEGDIVVPAIIAAYGIWATVAYYVAVAIVVTYVAQALSPKMPTGNAGSAGGVKSMMFNGAIQTTDQGGPIPILYGKKLLVGSTVIGSDLDYYKA